MIFKLRIAYYWLKIFIRGKFKNRNSLELYQRKRLAEFQKRKLQNNPYYQRLFEKNSIHWDKLPLMNKELFMEHFNALNSCTITKDEAIRVALEAERSRDFKNEIKGITVGLSTGTSGKRGIFLVSKKERAQWVALVMHRVIKPIFGKKQKVAFVLRANSNLYSSVASSLFDFKYFDLFLPIDSLLQELQLAQSDIIAAPPSVLMDIYKAQKEERIHLKPMQIISFAEVLHESDRRCIENLFNLKIKEVYQCTEGFLGVSCAYGKMHLNEDFVLFEKEWLDDRHFHPIITDFSRETQLIVRYKMNDILRVAKEPCSCGSPLITIEKIIGRDDEILIIDHTHIYPDLIARKIAIATDSFSEYVIEQRSPTYIQVFINCKESEYEEVSNKITLTLHTFLQLYTSTEVTIRCKKGNPYLKGDKMRKIRRCFDPKISI